MDHRAAPTSEYIPVGILRSASSITDARPAREVRIDTGDLPSRRYDLSSKASTRGTITRRRTWTQRSNAASSAVQSLPSHVPEGEESTSSPSMGRRSTGNMASGMAAHADQIVAALENDPALMEDNPLAQQLRMETLKDMPESLTLKRTIRRKLLKTVSMKSTKSPISMWKRCKYSISMSWAKFNLTVKDLLYRFELWYQSLKVIEGHFGSGVATYFKFLRWLFILNVLFCTASIIFIVAPQLIYIAPKDTAENVTNLLEYLNISSAEQGALIITPMPQTSNSSIISSQRQQFRFEEIFTGEGYFTDTALYYGHYVNKTVHSIPGLPYSIPNAYFIVSLACLIFVFVTLSFSSARSYRKSFIEAEGGLKNVYSHKVFCGWDCSIATGEGSRLKSRAIFNELKELLGEDSLKRDQPLNACGKLVIQIAVNVLCLGLLTGTAFLMWTLLNMFPHSIIVSVVATLIMIAVPMLFTFLLRFEGYRNPRAALYITLLRSFLLQAAIVATLVVFWLNKANSNSNECWETSLAQEIYRLVLMDFWLAIIGTALAEFLRSKLSKWFAFFGAPEFDIARNTLNLIYNQTLFWTGAFFSPLLSVIIVIKMTIMFYLRKTCVMNNCQPSARSWRAAQTQTIFLVLAFFSLLGIISTIGYIITQVSIKGEECGPFRAYDFMYEVVPGGIFNLEKGNYFWKLVLYLKKPGIQAGMLLAMCVGVYYLRAQSQGQQRLVLILREMLTLEALDKEYLLSEISKSTSGQWMYALNADKLKSEHRSFNSSAAGDSKDDSTSSSVLTRVTSSTSVNVNNDEISSFSESADGSVVLSDEALNNYEGTRIRALRSKHISK